jgi:hypothetical protein
LLEVLPKAAEYEEEHLAGAINGLTPLIAERFAPRQTIGVPGQAGQNGDTHDDGSGA